MTAAISNSGLIILPHVSQKIYYMRAYHPFGSHANCLSLTQSWINQTPCISNYIFLIDSSLKWGSSSAVHVLWRSRWNTAQFPGQGSLIAAVLSSRLLFALGDGWPHCPLPIPTQLILSTCVCGSMGPAWHYPYIGSIIPKCMLSWRVALDWSAKWIFRPLHLRSAPYRGVLSSLKVPQRIILAIKMRLSGYPGVSGAFMFNSVYWHL